MTTTPNIAMIVPAVGADNNGWGGDLNTNLGIIDALWINIGNVAFGGAATQGIGTSGSVVPLLSTANTWADPQTFTGLTSTNDITVNRTAVGTPTTGAIFFGNSGAHFLYCDGTNLTVGGTGTFFAPSGGFSGALHGNADTATTATNATNATAATSATTARNLTDGTSGPNEIVWDDTNGQWVFYVRGSAVAVVDHTGPRSLV